MAGWLLKSRHASSKDRPSIQGAQQKKEVTPGLTGVLVLVLVMNERMDHSSGLGR